MLEESDSAYALFDPDPGGMLIMMGQHDRSEALFHYFRLEEYLRKR